MELVTANGNYFDLSSEFEVGYRSCSGSWDKMCEVREETDKKQKVKEGKDGRKEAWKVYG
jgi:hypothetical protein